jgi:hypothetical protein
MPNIQHSSLTANWFTPFYLVKKVHQVIGIPDLDPASCEKANQAIKAKRIFTKKDNALNQNWQQSTPISIYLNPPGGKQSNKSLASLFWQKLVNLRDAQMLEEAIFLGFSIEHLAVTQSCSMSICDFPICIPKKRIKFVSPEGNFSSPTHSNVIAYVPGILDNTSTFKQVFSDLGKVLQPSN